MEKDLNIELNKAIDEILRKPPDIGIPADFTDRVVFAAMKRQTMKESLKEFFYKCLIAIASFIVFGIIFYFVTVRTPDMLLSVLLQNWRFILIVAFLGFFVLFNDQVILKYLFRKSRSFF
ncbi:MAG: hypothetical protein M0P58_04335 [Bacteroidales bacterium]|jgi:hypothetical protein|nr:hypothetical protein [Bacteroidales bacterium]